ncbi:hypothetical protein evm_007681 [Chilo suppressalis]|nr:hypothetical protein evm_007681 [Chilo suppressalis]
MRKKWLELARRNGTTNTRIFFDNHFDMSHKLVPAKAAALTQRGYQREHTPEGRKLKKCRRPASPEVFMPSGSSPKKSRRSLELHDEIVMALQLSEGSEEEETDDELEYNSTLRKLLRQDLGDDGCEGIDDDVVEADPSEGGMIGEVEECVEGGDLELRAVGPGSVNNDFCWTEDFSSFSGQQESYLRAPGPTVKIKKPTELFMAVWNEKIMKEIVRQTNEYAWQRIAPICEVESELPDPLSEWSDVTTGELYRYFAILILMSFCNRTVMSDYWTTGVLGMPNFRQLMARNRFFLITRFIHFVDNDTCNDLSLSSYDKKIFKIRPILDHCNERFAALYTPYRHLSLDESLLLWKGRLSWAQRIRSKAARFGIKSFELCEAETGYLLRCLLYAGKDSTMHEQPIHGFKNSTAKVVLELMDGFLDAGHCLVMDSWYNQLPLIRYLKESRKTDVFGTINPRQVHVPDDIKQANLTKIRRGDQISRHCGDICLMAWKDVKLVTTVSTFHNDSCVPGRRAGVPFAKPIVIADYNRYMGGVDSKDQQLSMYLMERKRGMKWYIKVFKRLLNTSLLNTYIIHKKNPVASRPLTHRQFRTEVALGLLDKFPKRGTGRNTKPNDPEASRRLLKGVNHFVKSTPATENRKTQKRCVRCLAAKRRTMVSLMCSYCDVALCAGSCWVEYHTLTKL